MGYPNRLTLLMFLSLLELMLEFGLPHRVFAEEEHQSSDSAGLLRQAQNPGVPSVGHSVPPEQTGKPAPVVAKKSKGRILREKEAEGTQAPNRFSTDIIFKSKYEFDGKSLEVDTD